MNPFRRRLLDVSDRQVNDLLTIVGQIFMCHQSQGTITSSRPVVVGLVVSMIIFYSDSPSLNHTEVHKFNCVKFASTQTKINAKRPVVDHLKTKMVCTSWSCDFTDVIEAPSTNESNKNEFNFTQKYSLLNRARVL